MLALVRRSLRIIDNTYGWLDRWSYNTVLGERKQMAKITGTKSYETARYTAKYERDGLVELMRMM